MIDIVVTYLNERDEKWQQDFNYWKNKEVQEGKANLSNRQAFGVERTREWDAFKYWFRGVEKNCPWVNKVFLIVQNENHIPKWIDKSNHKLRIVYHEEYIPKELLPTFNAMTIGLYISNIKDLSENYIMCDDDYYFLNKINKDRFFRDNIPVHQDNRVRFMYYMGDVLSSTSSVFYQILNNDLDFEQRFMNKKVKYGIYHLPEARRKSFEQDILNKYNDEILKHQITSKFRNRTNLCSYMYSDLLKICNKAVLDNPYVNCSYCTLKSTVDFDSYKDKDIVCFNDTEQLDNYDKTKEKLIEFLNKKLPKKSKYEE
jgi:hypothetical protein